MNSSNEEEKKIVEFLYPLMQKIITKIATEEGKGWIGNYFGADDPIMEAKFDPENESGYHSCKRCGACDDLLEITQVLKNGQKIIGKNTEGRETNVFKVKCLLCGNLYEKEMWEE